MQLKRRLLSTAASFIVMLSMALGLAIPNAADAANQILSGSAVEGNLRITVYDEGMFFSPGGIYIERYASATWEQQTLSKGSALHVNGSKCSMGNYFYEGTQASSAGNSTNGNKITTSLICSNGTSVTQEVTYIDGNAYLAYKWTITNTSGSAISDLRFFHGQDTYMANGDFGAGFWDSASKSVGVKRQSPAGSGNWLQMSLQGVTVPFKYQSENYSTVRDSGNAGALTGAIDANETTDNGYALEWRNASLAAGASWTINAYEKFGNVSAGGLAVSPPVAATIAPGATVPVSYTVQNTTGSADTASLSATVDKPGWVAVITSPGSSTAIGAGGSVTVTVNVTAPAGATNDTTARVTLTATGTTTASDFCSVTVAGAVPGPPTTTAIVDWTAMGITGTFSVTRSGGGETNKPITLAAPSSPSFTDTGLLYNTVYNYTITGTSGGPGTLRIHTPLYTDWNTVGVPNSSTTVTGGTVSTYYEWVPSGTLHADAAAYDTDGSYLQVSTPVFNKGYFAKPSNATTTLDSEIVGSIDAITLKTGYTLISPPADLPTTSWNINGVHGDIHSPTSPIDPTLYYWNGIAYDDVPLAGSLEKFKAYWILNTGAAVTLYMFY